MADRPRVADRPLVADRLVAMESTPGDAPLQLPPSVLDDLRRSDFARLDSGGHRYFDYTGAGLAAQRQIDATAELWSSQVLGNPHSENPTSTPATELVEETRQAVLEFFGATDHECVFTANASGALRLVGESFPFGAERSLAISADNHNSVNGIGEFARRAGAPVHVLPLLTPSLELDPAPIDMLLAAGSSRRPGLFAFPAQSNYSGVQHPLEMVDRARGAGWRVLLDTAAFAPTNRLDLSEVAADFVCISFYKMFGLPTGVGALIARREALAELQRPWFAGGTISMVSVAAGSHRLSRGHAGFEDGTANFASIPAVRFGLDLLDEVGIDTVHDHVTAAGDCLLGALRGLQHSNGEPMIGLLGASEGVPRGGTIAFNLLDPSGMMVRDRAVTVAAAEAGVSLRWGCFCNPGCGEAARELDAADMAPYFERVDAPDFCDLDEALWASRGTGASALRASVGWATNTADLQALMRLLSGFRDRPASSLVPMDSSPRGLPDAP